MRSPTSRLFAWPGGRHLIEACVLGAGVMAWFCLVYGGADWVTAQRTTRFAVHWEMERHMPFVPGMVVFYMSLYLLFVAAPFILRASHELRALTATLASVIFAAGVCFLAFPAELAHEAQHDWGVWRRWYEVADRMNLQYNLAPSLHVTLSIVCIDIFAARASLPGKAFFWLWGAAIALSTLLIHEHHLLDVATGWLLALAGSKLVYGRWHGAKASSLLGNSRHIAPRGEAANRS